jgi:hypothetical protein
LHTSAFSVAPGHNREHLLAAARFDSQGHHQQKIMEFDAVDQDGRQVQLPQRPFPQSRQARSTGRLPMPAHGTLLDAVAVADVVDHPLVVAQRHAADHALGHGPLQPSVALEQAVALQANLSAIAAAHPRALDRHLPACVGHVALLLTPTHASATLAVPVASACLLLDLLIDQRLDHQQARFGPQGLHAVAEAGQDLRNGQRELHAGLIDPEDLAPKGHRRFSPGPIRLPRVLLAHGGGSFLGKPSEPINRRLSKPPPLLNSLRNSGHPRQLLLFVSRLHRETPFEW